MKPNRQVNAIESPTRRYFPKARAKCPASSNLFGTVKSRDLLGKDLDSWSEAPTLGRPECPASPDLRRRVGESGIRGVSDQEHNTSLVTSLFWLDLERAGHLALPAGSEQAGKVVMCQTEMTRMRNQDLLTTHPYFPLSGSGWEKQDTWPCRIVKSRDGSDWRVSDQEESASFVNLCSSVGKGEKSRTSEASFSRGRYFLHA